MATIIAIAAPAVPIEQYLRTSYDPDVEYVDGELKARPVVMSVHGTLQVLIASWFQQHKDEWKLRTAVEVRTRVSPTRVRLPDLVVGPACFWPETLVEPPLLVVEILSPTDTYAETRRKIQDYLEMGIRTVWVIDPETRKAEIFGDHPQAEASHLTIAGSEAYVDLEPIFAEFDQYQQEPAPPAP